MISLSHTHALSIIITDTASPRRAGGAETNCGAPLVILD